MKKPVFYTEAAYIFGICIMAFSTALTEAADFGVSMIVAPAYILYRYLSPTYPFFTFGMAEYTLQAVLLVCMILILRKFRVSYLFSFVTAVLYGFTLDACMKIVAGIPHETLALRLLFFVAGSVFCSLSVSLFFHSYIAPEVYELLVKELSARFHVNIHAFKTGYDCTSFALSILLSFLLFGFGEFVGVRLGTLICALFNGWLISRWTHFLDKTWDFRDRWNGRKFFM